MEDRVLNWINNFREKVGVGPIEHMLPGEPQNMDHCTITNTIAFSNDRVWDVETVPFADEEGNLVPFRGSVHRWGYLAYETESGMERIEIPLPKYVAQFAADFDSNKYPHLVEG